MGIETVNVEFFFLVCVLFSLRLWILFCFPKHSHKTDPNSVGPVDLHRKRFPNGTEHIIWIIHCQTQRSFPHKYVSGNRPMVSRLWSKTRPRTLKQEKLPTNTKIALKRNISRRFLSVLHQTVSREGYLHQTVSRKSLAFRLHPSRPYWQCFRRMGFLDGIIVSSKRE